MKTFTKSTSAASGESMSFDDAYELINPHLYTVEERIRQQSKVFEPAIEGYVTYVTHTGGKRLRPALTLLSAGATGKITPGHVDLAVIVELIHVATLVHDDIMDGADTRRDQPTANAKWGNAISVLLGDCLFAHALRLSTNFSNNEISRRIADAAAEVCSGEIIQTQRRFDLKLSLTDYYKIIEMKTAALFSVACELSAYISESSPEIISALRTYGRKLGIAYQIYDDCVDLVGDENEVGKTLGTDLQKGKFTLPVLYLMRHGKAEQVSALRELVISEESSKLEELAGLLVGSGAVQSSIRTAREMVQDAQTVLDVVPTNRYLQGLRAVGSHVDRLLERLQ